MGKRKIESLFPGLAAKNYDITSPVTSFYNCIAWAAGDAEAWWWPDKNNLGYWPENCRREETLNAFISAFESLGYKKCKNFDYETGYEKVALYTDEHGKPTHAARQIDSVFWTSKLGKLEDIKHTLKVIEGCHYGVVNIIMKRICQNEKANCS